MSKIGRVFIETSVFIRFLTQDDLKKYKHCQRLFEAVTEGKIRPYTSNTVIMEIIFILERHYHFPKHKVLSAIDKLLLLRNLTLVEKTNTKHALALYKDHGIKYGDCLIVSQIPAEVTLISYDSDFKKIKELKTISPEELLKSQ